jgi:hypothetical protein
MDKINVADLSQPYKAWPLPALYSGVRIAAPTLASPRVIRVNVDARWLIYKVMRSSSALLKSAAFLSRDCLGFIGQSTTPRVSNSADFANYAKPNPHCFIPS